MRIGIYGGTFNPPHFGHKNLALKIKSAAELDKIIVIPTFTPPHKENKAIVDGFHRIQMCKLLFDEDYFEVSDIEIKREGKSYTFDTLCELKKIYPDDELFLIMGSDMLLSFHKWYRFRDILTMATLCVASRENKITVSRLEDYAAETLNKNAEKGEIVIVNLEPVECSSTDVRRNISLGLGTSTFIPGDVDKYIKLNLLYDSPYMEYKKLLREKLDDFRFYHSLNVAESAKLLAKKYGENEDKAYLTGLLHDSMKNANKQEMLQMIEKGGIILNRVERNNPKLWHAIAGAVFVQVKLGIMDTDIISAIRYHTTGKSGMTTFDKIIYIADYVSVERDYPDVETMRFLSLEKGLDEASLYSLQYSLKSLSEKKMLIHNDSLEFYNELILKLN